jgi:hypothetical protein
VHTRAKDRRVLRTKGIVCPCILVPNTICTVQGVEKVWIDNMELVRADTNDWTCACQLWAYILRRGEEKVRTNRKSCAAPRFFWCIYRSTPHHSRLRTSGRWLLVWVLGISLEGEGTNGRTQVLRSMLGSHLRGVANQKRMPTSCNFSVTPKKLVSRRRRLVSPLARGVAGVRNAPMISKSWQRLRHSLLHIISLLNQHESMVLITKYTLSTRRIDDDTHK